MISNKKNFVVLKIYVKIIFATKIFYKFLAIKIILISYTYTYDTYLFIHFYIYLFLLSEFFILKFKY